MTLAPSAPPPLPASTPDQPARHRTAADWLASLGNVPLDRIVFDPLPGTVTIEQYEKLDGRVGESLVELVDQTLVEKPMGYEESRIALNVALIVGTFVKAQKIGTLAGADGMLRMSAGNIRVPDVSFISTEDFDAHLAQSSAAPRLRPTLAIEVVSPSNTSDEIRLKVEDYFASGGRLVWILHPKARLVDVYTSPTVVHTLRAEDTLTGGGVLPGFSVQVAELFEI